MNYEKEIEKLKSNIAYLDMQIKNLNSEILSLQTIITEMTKDPR